MTPGDGTDVVLDEFDTIVNLDHERLVRVSEVFVTAAPDYTYTSRNSVKLEDDVRDHLEERDKLLLITGPTKIGKTVLVDHVVPTETDTWVKVEGPTVTSVRDVWNQVVDDLGYFIDESREASRKEADGSSIGTSVGVDVMFLKADVNTGSDGTVETAAAKSRGIRREPRTVAREALLETGATLIIDDFHHIAPEVQAQLGTPVEVSRREAPRARDSDRRAASFRGRRPSSVRDARPAEALDGP